MHKSLLVSYLSNKEQAELMSKAIECSRFVYHHFLDKMKRGVGMVKRT
jgi:hypothetical protein